MRQETAQGRDARLAVEMRLCDCIGFLDRARSRLYVPITQACKAIAYLASGTPTSIWVAERKARRKSDQRLLVRHVPVRVHAALVEDAAEALLLVLVHQRALHDRVTLN